MSKRLATSNAFFQSWLEGYLEDISVVSTVNKALYDSPLSKQCIDLTDEEVIVYSTSSNIATSEQSSSSSHAAIMNEKAQLREQALKNQQTMPTTIQGFKNHPYYLLERHLLSDETLNPNKKVVAIFKGEPVYLQEHKEKLRTKLFWRRELREIKGNEIPLKVVKRKVFKSRETAATAEPGHTMESKEMKLFAKYQTQPMEVMLFSVSLVISFPLSLVCATNRFHQLSMESFR
jgi:hypothetical protein